MAAAARGRGSRQGINGAILEAGLGSNGTVLEADAPAARRRTPDIGNSASGARAVQSRAAGTQEGFPRCRTPGEAVGGPGIESELCARCRTAAVADGDTPKVSTDAEPGTVTEPSGESAGRGAYQVVQLRLRPVGPQCTTYAEGAGRWGNQPSSSGCTGGSEIACHAGAVV